MSRIDELIEELCSNGVEFKELGEVYDFQYGEGNNIPKEGGIYPIYGSNGIVGTHHKYNSEDAPVIGHIGAYAGIVNWAKGKHFVTYNGVICKIKKNIEPRFGYYLLLSQDFISKANSGSQPFVSYGMLNKIKIPLPPLPIQKEIVKILDQFTELEENLTKELEKRKKQYEYYREELLKFDEEDVEWRELNILTNISVGNKPRNEINMREGKFPYINAGSELSGYTDRYNSDNNMITIPSRGYGRAGHVSYQKSKFWCGPLCYKIQSKNNKSITKFIYYYLKSIQKDLIALRKTGSIPAVNKSDISELKIPLPHPNDPKKSLEIQQQIVEKLDKFDELVNEVLPKEIELRRKQYEFYREKLLTFEELKNE